MDRPLTRPLGDSAAMEIEVSRQNSSSDMPEPFQPASRFAELQLRREKRRTSENKFANPTNPEVVELARKLCDFCRQLILINIYEQHVLDCGRQKQEQSQENSRLTEEVQEPQNQEEANLSNTMETEENQLQVAMPSQNLRPDQPQEGPENFFNLFGRFRNPLRNFQSPEPSQPRLPSPTSFFSNIFNSIFSPRERTGDLPIEQPAIEGTNPPNTDQPHDESDIFPRGALLVRTIQPGPNGSIIVRMRVIPLDGLFGNAQENEEGNEPQEGRLLGSLLNMLMTLHGVHGGGFGDFMNLFQEEKGLEKEALDSLPIVPYDSETFKNVDDESKKCPICLEQFEDKQEVRFLWCLHRFHKNCVDQWLDKHTNCPICKKDYSEAVKSCEETSKIN